MNRKDYELIAKVIANSQGLTRKGVIDTLARRMAEALQADNPRFDRVRFLEACEVK
jgi:hypothetical protein